jgi:hypothetical protein
MSALGEAARQYQLALEYERRVRTETNDLWDDECDRAAEAYAEMWRQWGRWASR